MEKETERNEIMKHESGETARKWERERERERETLAAPGRWGKGKLLRQPQVALPYIIVCWRMTKC